MTAAVPSHAVSAGTMSPAMREAERYHDWVFDLIRDGLRGGRCLEIGAGHGEYSRRIAERVDHLLVADRDPAAVAGLAARFAGRSGMEFLAMDGIEPSRLRGRRFDAIVLLNVLEHIRDDDALIRACRNALVEGGRLIVQVPALPALFARLDAEAGHFRRYDRRRLLALVRHGFAIERLAAFNAAGIPGWLWNKWRGSSLRDAGLNRSIRAFDRWVPWLRRLDALLPSVGLSLILIARKEVGSPAHGRHPRVQ